jgi:hypothetical protein
LTGDFKPAPAEIKERWLLLDSGRADGVSRHTRDVALNPRDVALNAVEMGPGASDPRASIMELAIGKEPEKEPEIAVRKSDPLIKERAQSVFEEFLKTVSSELTKRDIETGNIEQRMSQTDNPPQGQQ